MKPKQERALGIAVLAGITLKRYIGLLGEGDAMSVIDIHSHILPGIDDGSRTVEKTLEMLELCAMNGVDEMIASPHFYAHEDKVDRFLHRRQQAYEQVQAAIQARAMGGNNAAIGASNTAMETSNAAMGNNNEAMGTNNTAMGTGNTTRETQNAVAGSGSEVMLPTIRLGAEVAFFPGMSKAERITEFTIQGTNIMLLEMPFQPWDDSVIQEVKSLIKDRQLRIIIAHLERFLKLPGNQPYIKELLKLPVKVQINAESLEGFFARRELLHMFEKEQAHFLGSDCHGMNHRPPNLWQGRERIRKKLGASFLIEMDEKLEAYLNEA